MKVLLISANRLSAPYPVYPLSLDYVAASIKDRHETLILDINNYRNNEDISADISAFSPDITGLSLRNVDNTDTTNIRSFLEEYSSIISVIRKAADCPVVLGGCGFTIFPEKIMEALGADYGIIGEGERLPLLLAALEAGTDPAGIPGLIVKGSSGLNPGPFNGEIRRDFNPQNAHTAYYLRRGGMLNLQSKRGCSFRCIYCTYPHIEGDKLRLFPPEEIASTALKLRDAGAKYFFITDSAFNCSYEHSLEVGRAFIKAGLNIPWGAFFAPTEPPDTYYSTLKKAGLSHAEFGTESLSDSMLRSYRKPFNSAMALSAHRKALDAGLHIAHYFMLGGPGESPDTLAETLENIEKIQKAAFFFFCGVRIYPHTALYDIAVSEGQIKHGSSLIEPVFYRSPAISEESIIETVKKQAKGRANWFIGSGGSEIENTIRKMYRRKYSGPLWEMAIP